MSSFSRIILRNKPAGVTSNEVVAEVRREYGPRRWKERVKVGHAGTLDPFATGLLVVLVGAATRLQPFIQGLPKTYVATAQLGWRSTTGDPDGELSRTGRIPSERALPTGLIEQSVPMTSAVRVDGERLYRKAHRGETIERPSRPVEVYGQQIIAEDEASGTITFEIHCSAGTYIRTLIETLEDAYCSTLRRIAVGDMAVPESGYEEIAPSEALSHLPCCELSQAEAEEIAHGRAIAAPAGESTAPEGSADRVVLTRAGELIAIADPEHGRLQPRVVLV